VDKLEDQIIQVFDDNKLNHVDYEDLKIIFIRYKLKSLYLVSGHAQPDKKN
jgi:hypothetical protein